LPDLSDVDLRYDELNRANLSYADLSGADLTQTDLSLTNLRGADLRGTTLICANLRHADLNDANLSGANLGEADLTHAKGGGVNLSRANLPDAKLSYADLSRADLTDANLTMSQVIGTNFHNAILTDACIEGWYINSKTNLDGVICEYVYIDQGDDCYFNESKTERRPINGNFAPGEFASLYKKIIETTDLILSKTLENENTLNKPEKNINVENTSNNKGVYTWERLRFRSKPEIKIAEALDRAGVLFIPNSSARLNTTTGRGNKEPDFLICYNGKWGILEVDGPFHTAERRVEEQERERIFKKNGIKVVERFDSQRCSKNPDEVVQEFFKMIEIGYS
ncbi:pentapeptide repeat-containing protein, partial [Anabaena sp. UHCC 0451]|uniref:pentapeptide repeat-containing protein n=1 Tax=Anabaena sp. UHCC 0451 TaxID=2055235 RepID=UPI002B20DC68